MICACLPTLPNLFKAWHKKLTSNQSSGGITLLRIFRSRDEASQPRDTHGSHEHFDGELAAGRGYVSDAQSSRTGSSLTKPAGSQNML